MDYVLGIAVPVIYIYNMITDSISFFSAHSRGDNGQQAGHAWGHDPQ